MRRRDRMVSKMLESDIMRAGTVRDGCGNGNGDGCGDARHVARGHTSHISSLVVELLVRLCDRDIRLVDGIEL
jgi:hypothetical protein